MQRNRKQNDLHAVAIRYPITASGVYPLSQYQLAYISALPAYSISCSNPNRVQFGPNSDVLLYGLDVLLPLSAYSTELHDQTAVKKDYVPLSVDKKYRALFSALFSCIHKLFNNVVFSHLVGTCLLTIYIYIYIYKIYVCVKQ